jgi:hypothetical protein
VAIFHAVAGQTYQIAVDSAESGVVGFGEVTLTIQRANPPPNDDFADRIVLSGEEVFTCGSNIDATAEPGEPTTGFFPPESSVWWSWTAPASGQVTMTTEGSDFGTRLAVYTGSQVSVLTLVTNDDFFSRPGGFISLPGFYSPGAYVAFQAVAGVAYQIAVDGYYGSQGSINLGIVFEAAPAAAADAVVRLMLFADGDHFRLHIAGRAGTKISLEHSHDLVNWTPFTSTTLTDGATNVVDPDSVTTSVRFYRARVED